MRVDRCFAFVDLCGFTRFAEKFGDERVVLVLADLRTALRESCARRGVRIVKWLGDGAMLSSTMPDAVVNLVVEIHQRMLVDIPTLPLRAGISSGPVIMFEGDDYIGRAVNIASRLCDEARPHEILATVHTTPVRSGWVDAEPARSIFVRGVNDEIAAHRLLFNGGDSARYSDPVCGLALSRGRGLVVDDHVYCSDACFEAWRDRR